LRAEALPFREVFGRVRYFASDLAFWIRTNPFRALAGVLALGAVGFGVYIGVDALSDESPNRLTSAAPQVVVVAGEPVEAPAELGFPAFATRNTTRVAGADAVTNAAGVALATFPAGGAVEGPDAVTIVDSEDWAAGVAAAALIAEPVGSPILFSSGGELSELTAGALAALGPGGGAGTGGKEVFVVGEAAEPEGLKTRSIRGASAAELAAELAALREELTGDSPRHLVIASSDAPEFAMPAAAWSARSGDPVLFAQANSVPEATLDAIEKLGDVPIYILGGEEVISDKAATAIEKAAEGSVKRASDADDPVTNAIEFARYADGTFGWDINDPGHGFVIVNTARPADAAAAAPLSGTGKYGPLLLTEDADSAPAELEGYLLDLKPGFETDPTRAIYNHIWIIGDEESISVETQVMLDEIAEVAQVESGSGESIIGGASQGTEPEGADRGGSKKQDDSTP